MKVVVMGGAGFIGSWLCEELLERGYDVLCIDNMSTGSKHNISNFRKNRKFRFIRKDVTSIKSLKKFDAAFHLASPASPKHFELYPVEIMMANSLGTKNILDEAKRHKATLIFASTSEVYGDPKEHPQREEYWGNVNPNGIRSCYDESKRFGEAICMAYHRAGTDVRIARIFNTYGPRMRKDDGRAIPDFITRAIKNDDMIVHGNGKQTRSFCYVSDMVRGIMKILEKGNGGEVINLGNPDEHRIIDVARKIKSISKSRSEIVFSGMPKDDPQRRRPDISKAKSLLGWQPEIRIDDGLAKTIEHFRTFRI